jgi:hypothetical protein
MLLYNKIVFLLFFLLPRSESVRLLWGKVVL